MDQLINLLLAQNVLQAKPAAEGIAAYIVNLSERMPFDASENIQFFDAEHLKIPNKHLPSPYLSV